ncbi:MAG: pilin [Azoarcus sp.]|nr:pilin [Azoarcus sp.]
MSELILAGSVCRSAVTEASLTGLSAPAKDGFGCGEGGASDNPVSQYVQSISTSEAGVITIVARNISQLDATHNTLTLNPYTDADATTGKEATKVGLTKSTAVPIKAWKCGGTGTSIEAKYLPISCR